MIITEKKNEKDTKSGLEGWELSGGAVLQLQRLQTAGPSFQRAVSAVHGWAHHFGSEVRLNTRAEGGRKETGLKFELHIHLPHTYFLQKGFTTYGLPSSKHEHSHPQQAIPGQS